MNNAHYLVFANVATQNNIYKWNGSQFVAFQSINVSDAFAWESFEINGDTYLALALYRYEKRAGYNKTALIYKWNGSQFVIHQQLDADNPLDLEAIQIGADHFLAMGNYGYGGQTKNAGILKWNASTQRFDPFQEILVDGAQKWSQFTKDGVSYFILARDVEGSLVYRWSGSDFELYRTIFGAGKWEWSFVEAGTQTYLLTGGVYYANGSYNTASEVYRFE